MEPSTKRNVKLFPRCMTHMTKVNGGFFGVVKPDRFGAFRSAQTSAHTRSLLQSQNHDRIVSEGGLTALYDEPTYKHKYLIIKD